MKLNLQISMFNVQVLQLMRSFKDISNQFNGSESNFCSLGLKQNYILIVNYPTVHLVIGKCDTIPLKH